MSKCENCIHDAICSADAYFKSIDGCEKYCLHYKDKSLFVELPCKVGDVLHWSSRGKPCPYRVLKIECRGKDVIIVTKSLYSGGTVKFYGREIGKIVFLTKEEAEKKLKEMG